TAEIGIETADLYPSLRIPGSVTLDLGGTIDRTELVGTISSVIDIPLFDAGRRRAEIRGAKARARAAVSDYEQSVLSALADVEIALVGINAAELQLREFQSAVESSEYAFDQLTALYREGLATFIDILDAQRTLIANREAYVDAEAAAAISVVDLYFAVGSPTGTPETEAARLSRPARKSLFRAIEALEQPSETESTPEATGHNGTGAPLNQSN
ncbi:MAG: TolC family protein, partial [Pseudomonadota bacterium]